tara:strand:+ start:73 stop:303 length:231 start_codon:yes stop_codon:yes gene_type:complete
MTELSILIALLSAISFLIFLVNKFKNENIILKNQIEQINRTPQKSEELTDFLRDVQVNGFSFVRVAPDSVILRSPR